MASTAFTAMNSRPSTTHHLDWGFVAYPQYAAHLPLGVNPLRDFTHRFSVFAAIAVSIIMVLTG